MLGSQPNSQDEVIRAQVLEALDVVETFQAAVEAAGESLGSPSQPVPPMDRLEAGLTQYPTDTTGNYFESVDIWNGTIVVEFGHEANVYIQGEMLGFTPYESADGTIVWRCGYAHYPQGTSLMGTMAGTGPVSSYFVPSPGLREGYLPQACRTW